MGASIEEEWNMARATTLPRAIVDLSEFTESKNIMVYGDSGAGKTGLIGCLPGKVLILSSENGTVVIKRMAKRFGWDEAGIAKRIKVWAIRSWQDMEDAYSWVSKNTDVFDWIAIDSITSIQTRAMRAAMEIAVKRSPEKRDIDLPDRGEHQKMQNAVKRMVVDFNELPVNILWTAQAMNREDKDGNDIVLPFIMGKDYEVSAFVCAQMHAYFYLQKRPHGSKPAKGNVNLTERILLSDSFASSEGVYYWAKDRYMVMPPVALLSVGEEQKTSFTDLLGMIDADSDAVVKATAAVETYDEEEDGEPEPEPADEEEPEPEGEELEEDPAITERRDELTAMTVNALKKVVGSLEIDAADLKGLDKAGVVEAILDNEFGVAEEEPEDDEPEEEPDDEPEVEEEPTEEPEDAEEEDDDDDEDEPEVEDDSDGYDERIAELSALNKADLKAAVIASGLTIADLKGLSKAQVVEAIVKAEVEAEAEEPEEDDDDGFDEPEEEPEPEPVKPAKKVTRLRAVPNK
jgi:hypothetical protein